MANGNYYKAKHKSEFAKNALSFMLTVIFRSDHLDLPFLAFECCMGGIEPVGESCIHYLAV